MNAILMMPPQGEPQRLVYIVPLVGSGASQQLLLFKNMVRRGSALLSFEYQGHGKSTGAFSLATCFENARTVLAWAERYTASNGLPLHGLATCFGNLPMLSWFQGSAGPAGLRTVNAVSGLFDLRQIIRVEDFLARYRQNAGIDAAGAEEFLRRVEEGSVELAGRLYRDTLRSYLQSLFPELRVTQDSFEQLEFDRVDMRRTVLQFHRAQSVDGISVPPELPCLFFYGVRDELMGLDQPMGRLRYEKRIASLVPQAQVRAMDIDHFGRGTDHNLVIEQLCDHVERHDRAGGGGAAASKAAR